MTTTIEVFTIDDKGDHYLVCYDYEGSNVAHTIRRSDLIEFVVDEGLNLYEVKDERICDIEQMYVNPGTYLDENYRDIITNYLQFHLS